MDLNKLKQEMLQNGYPVENLISDGQYQRFEIQGHKGQPGYYSIRKSVSGLSAVYGDFVSGKTHKWTSSNNSKPSTPEEAAELKKQLVKEAAELEAKIKRKHEKGAMAANFFWTLGEDFKSHDYLKNKRVKNHGLKRCTMDAGYNGWLMVPGYNAVGELAIVQYINRDGQKRFETGCKKKGAFFEITGDGDRIIIAEGYSTAATIREAAGHAVIVAFDAGNLPHVAKVIREKYPDAEIIIAADNDQYKPDIGNVGVTAATDAAIQIDAKLAIHHLKTPPRNRLILTIWPHWKAWAPSEIRSRRRRPSARLTHSKLKLRKFSAWTHWIRKPNDHDSLKSMMSVKALLISISSNNQDPNLITSK